MSDNGQMQLSFWTGFTSYIAQRNGMLEMNTPRAQNWLRSSSIRSGFCMHAVATTCELRAEMVMHGDSSTMNYDLLHAQKEGIEAAFGEPLNWCSKEAVAMKRAYLCQTADVQDQSKWPAYYEWLLDNLTRLHKTFDPFIKRLPNVNAVNEAVHRDMMESLEDSTERPCNTLESATRMDYRESPALDIEERQVAYQDLVSERKACSRCTGCLQNASFIDGGSLDSTEIGPYTQWQHNLSSPVVVVAQDFADIAGFRKYGGRAGFNVQTNLNLVRLLAEAGFHISPPPRHGESDNTLFFTNAVLCMKSGAQGGRQQRIPRWCFANCLYFLRRTIEIVSPKVVITLGENAVYAVHRAFGLDVDVPFSNVIGKPASLMAGVKVIPMYHPSPRVVNTGGGLEPMAKDWRKIRSLLG